MDRSLLDYGGGGGPPLRGAGSAKMVTSPLAMSPPPPAAAGDGGKLSPQQLRANSCSPVTPPVSPVSPACTPAAAPAAVVEQPAVVNGSQTGNHQHQQLLQQQQHQLPAAAAPNLIKKDMVVRFQENSSGGVTSNQTHLNFACQPQQLDASQMHSYSVESLPESSVEGMHFKNMDLKTNTIDEQKPVTLAPYPKISLNSAPYEISLSNTKVPKDNTPVSPFLKKY